MSDESFSALLAEQGSDGVTVRLADLRRSDLPDGEVLVRVAWSSLNYKDALGVTTRAPIFRSLPMVPGIDLAGSVVMSSSPRFEVGDNVFATGGGIGETRYGGYAAFAYLPSDLLLPVPDGWTGRHVMSMGTAGFTSMLCVMRLEELGVRPGEGPILVTGAGGGVGGFAVAILRARGYEVVAVTGRSSLVDYLTNLGADRVLDRSELDRPGKPLQKETWRGVVDSVGGQTLCTAIAQLQANGVVTACGLAGGDRLPASVYPFILRNVSLCGVDSVSCPRDRRIRTWAEARQNLSDDVIKNIAPHVIGLTDIVPVAQRLLQGEIQGRTLVKVS